MLEAGQTVVDGSESGAGPGMCFRFISFLGSGSVNKRLQSRGCDSGAH